MVSDGSRRSVRSSSLGGQGSALPSHSVRVGGPEAAASTPMDREGRQRLLRSGARSGTRRYVVVGLSSPPLEVFAAPKLGSAHHRRMPAHPADSPCATADAARTRVCRHGRVVQPVRLFSAGSWDGRPAGRNAVGACGVGGHRDVVRSCRAGSAAHKSRMCAAWVDHPCGGRWNREPLLARWHRGRLALCVVPATHPRGAASAAMAGGWISTAVSTGI